MSITITDNGNTVKWSDSENDKDVLFNKKELLTTYNLRAGRNIFQMRASDYTEEFLYGNVTSPSSTSPDDLLDQISAFSTSQPFTNIVFVNTIADFPAAVAGVITLANNTNYILLQPITTSNRFVLPLVGGLTSFNGSMSILTYTGTGTLFSGTTESFLFEKLVVFGNTNATLFDITGQVGATPGFVLGFFTSFLTFGTLGTITTATSNLFSIGFIGFTAGLTITNALNTAIDNGLWQGGSVVAKTYLTLNGAVSNGLTKIQNTIFTATTNESVLYVDPSIVITSAIITNNPFSNGTSQWFAAGSLDETDVRFTYDGNGDAPVSDEHAFMYITTPAAETVVPTTFEKIAGNYVAVNIERFTHANGVLTYTGKTTRFFTISMSLSITASDNNRTVDIRIAKNGTSDPVSNQRRKIATGADVGVIGITFQTILETGDTIEPMYTTVSTGTDLTAEYLTLAIQ